MGYLMKFPGGFEDVYRYVKTALIMRENRVRFALKLCNFTFSLNVEANLISLEFFPCYCYKQFSMFKTWQRNHSHAARGSTLVFNIL